MKIFICCSKWFYTQIPPIKTELESYGHIITLPNSYEKPLKEEEIKSDSTLEGHALWKASMIRKQRVKVENNNAILVLNFNKNGQENYIGGATFLEMYEAFNLNKNIYLFNPIPQNMLYDEINAFRPIIINGDLTKIKLLV